MMRIISVKAIGVWAARYPDAETWLKGWLKTARRWSWTSLQDVRRIYPHADGVLVASGRPVTIFNAAGNKYRLLAAMHYNRGLIYVLEFLTHAEYSKGRWMERL